MESYSVEAVLSAVDKNFTSSMNNANGSLAGLDNKATTAKTSIMDIAKGIGAFKIIDAGVSLLKDSVSSAISRVDTLNNSTRTFENMGFGKGETSKAMNELKKSIQGLPTPLDSAVKGMTALSATYGDVNLGQKIFSGLNNAILGFGGSTAEVDNAIMQLSQLPMDGPLDAQTWNSLRNSGLTPVLSAMAKESGMSVSSMKDAFGKGQLTVKDFTNKLIEMNEKGGGGLKSLEKIAKDSTNGIGTGISNMKTAVVRGMANVIESINSALKNTNLKSIANIFSLIGSKIEGLLTIISKTIPKIAQFFNDLLDTIAASGAYQILASAWNNIIDIFKILAILMKPLIDWFKSLWGTSDDVGGAVNGLASVFLVLAKTFDVATSALKTFFGFVNQNKDWIEPLVVGITAGIAAYKLWKGAITAWSTVTKIATAVQVAFNAVMDANPIMLIVIAIAAVVAGLVYFFTQTKTGQEMWSNFVKFLSSAWQSLVNIAKSVWSSITGAFNDSIKGIQDGWNGITSFFSNLWQGIVNTAVGIWNGFTSTLSGIWQGTVSATQSVWGAITGFFSGIWNGIISVATNLWSTFGPALTTIWQGIVTVAKGVWEILKTVIMAPILIVIDLITGGWNQLGSDLQLIWTSIVTSAQTIWTGIGTFFTGLWNLISTYFIMVWNFIYSTAVSIWNGIVSAAQNIWNGLVSFMTNLWNGIVSTAISAWNGLLNGIVSIANGIKDGAINAWNSLVNGIKNLIDSLVNGAISTWNNLKSSVINIANSIKDGAINAWNSLVSGVQSIIDSVVGIFNTLRNINLLDIGKAIIDGFINGLTGAWKKGMEFISGIGDWIREHKGPISKDRKLLTPAGNAIMDGLNAGLTGGFRDVQSNVSGMGDIIANAINSDYSVDIGANVAAANRSISSQISHDVNLNQGKQPALFNVRLGNQNFKAFVDDISNAQGQEINLNMGF